MTDDTSPENLRKFLESDDPAMVRMGISMAKGMDVEVPIKDMERFLKSDDIETIKMWFTIAEEAGVGDEAMEILCEPLDSVSEYLGGEEIEDVRYFTVKLLGEIGDERAVEPLIKGLSGASSNYIDEYDVVRALGKIGEPAVETLIRALSNWADDSSVRKFTAAALGEIGDARAVEALIELLGDDDDDYEVRGYAAKALGNIGDKRAVEPLIEVLLDSAWARGWIRAATVKALGKIGDVRAIEPLIKVLGAYLQHEHIRKSAAGALDKLGWTPKTDGQRAAYLIAVEDWQSLVEWGEPAVEPLIKALDGNSRESAIEALGEIGDARAVEPLIKVLDRDRGKREKYNTLNFSENALVRIGKPAVEPLIKALLSANSKMNDYSKMAGWDWKIYEGIKTASTLVKKTATTLGRIGDKRAVEPLIMLHSKRRRWRRYDPRWSGFLSSCQYSVRKTLKKLGHEVQ